MLPATRGAPPLLLLLVAGSCHLVACLQDSAASRVATLWQVTEAHQQLSAKLNEVLNRVGPNLRASANYHDFEDVRLNESIEAWQVLHSKAKGFAESQIEFYKPKVEQLLRDSNVSSDCLEAASLTLDSIASLKSWAVKMWSTSGNFPPSSFLDGQFTDLGSFKGCVDAQIGVGAAKLFDRTSYCVLAFRPIIPSRPEFHMILRKENSSLINLFDNQSSGGDDVFGDILQEAQYFHYIYLKTGVCVPNKCSPADLQLIARLIGRRLALMSGPVKCFTRTREKSRGFEKDSNVGVEGEIENQPILVRLDAELSLKQLISLLLVCTFFGLVLLASAWHAGELILGKLTKSCNSSNEDDDDDEIDELKLEHLKNGKQISEQLQTSRPFESGAGGSLARRVAFNYFSVITNGKQFLDTSTKANEIKCLHGLRVLTMIWIICVHTLQYNEWSGFTRIFELKHSLGNPAVHPLINANHVVDNFFLMSGLLTSYTIWHSNKGTLTSNFSFLTNLLNRYLRLTPQVLLISLLYILLPLLGQGPFWYDMTHDAAKYCEQNWWVNLLHIQSFYKNQQICNLVSWWISVDMLFYVVALVLLWLMLLQRTKLALAITICFVSLCTIKSVHQHYTGGFSPNNLATVPQVGEVWSKFVIDYTWSPWPHAFVFFLGLWLGHALANNKWQRQVRSSTRLGWTLSLLSLACVNYSSRLWVSGSLSWSSNQLISTSYNIICTMIWASAFGWIILACHYNCAPALNRFLSIKSFVMLSKASFIIYLSHMLILRAHLGSQSTLFEVSVSTMTFLMIGITVLSLVFGVTLCITFEGPCMKFQRFVAQATRSEKKRLPIAGSSFLGTNQTGSNGADNVPKFQPQDFKLTGIKLLS